MMTKLIDTSRPRYKSTFMGRIYIAVRHGRVLSALKKRIKPRLIRIVFLTGHCLERLVCNYALIVYCGMSHSFRIVL